MDFSFSPQEEAWRQEVRQFLKANPAENFPMEHGEEAWGFGGWSTKFTKLLGGKGWISRNWPENCGGQAKPWMDRLILLEELAYSRVPWMSMGISMSMGDTIVEIGTEEVKKKLLPLIANGDIAVWLAMSEPGAGSDLLSLETKAEDKGDYYLVNGQKVWSTWAHLSEYGELFARTELDPSVPRHKGLSMFILDKSLPGVTVRPLINLYGEACHTEVFMDNVKIPKEYLMGKKNDGFKQMLKTLEFDRFWARFIKPPFCKSVLEDLIKYTKETKRDGVVLAKDPVIRHKLAESAVEIEACRLLLWNAGCKLIKKIPLVYEASLGKVMADEVGQRLFNKGMQIMGPSSQLGEATKWAPMRAKMQRWYLYSIGTTLAGGTSEIIRNTIATVGLGLPRG